MRIGYVLGRQSPFSFSDARSFTEAFATDNIDARRPAPSRPMQWLQPASERKASSDEQFVEHFREQYDDRVPIWALTELLDLGQLSFQYRGLHLPDADEIIEGPLFTTAWFAMRK